MGVKVKASERAANEHLYGCCVELADDEFPDDCVLEYGAPGDCIHALRRKVKWTCPYWVLRSSHPSSARASTLEQD